ncbi:Glycosyltransferase, GT2 family [Lutibacter oricola]|uniref:Glycosyltransferase, GT2 family n=1 Tax=Lutibacter oricola TaxID=762486 RepID=A0A1H2X1F2_9FLAO|nr:glycosyltransferase [Lutibacter oricola]SDW86608.1 Glycosyltransferase, GT2 family [Lutibacter oricola]
MQFSLIICTYQRPKALLNLLNSIQDQKMYPNEIIIVDGSRDNKTKDLVQEYKFENLYYFKVEDKDRGLTRQRNYGISKVTQDSEVVCFLDDDTYLKKDYFKNLIEVFKRNQEIFGVGGVAINENRWIKKDYEKSYSNKKYFEFENYVVERGSRHILRNHLGLGSNKLPGNMPEFSHGTSYSYPLNGKFYEVDLLIGMSMSFRKQVTDSIKFSTYFEGYGLYEDADYSLRAIEFGKNVIATNVCLRHFHEATGRPNKYNYGKMVVRNGWYVWRIKYPKPKLEARLKWNVIIWLLIFIRLGNVITTKKKKGAFTEALGRIVGWFSLFLNKPKVER